MDVGDSRCWYGGHTPGSVSADPHKLDGRHKGSRVESVAQDRGVSAGGHFRKPMSKNWRPSAETTTKIAALSFVIFISAAF